MAYNLILADRADELIDGHVAYLLKKLKNPEAATHYLDGMDRIYDQLESNPYLYPECSDDFLRRKGYREALLPQMDYRVVFMVEGQTVYIVGVFHILEDYGRKVE
ncbi:MAG: type II toxin-antitoxin system RelE/ParE family toxin [Lachnospiraceae bacterium]|nr:type II toxin-antitoxin system RelE/ParE family toxin [Lachnospiraceae bacterium]